VNRDASDIHRRRIANIGCHRCPSKYTACGRQSVMADWTTTGVKSTCVCLVVAAMNYMALLPGIWSDQVLRICATVVANNLLTSTGKASSPTQTSIPRHRISDRSYKVSSVINTATVNSSP